VAIVRVQNVRSPGFELLAPKQNSERVPWIVRGQGENSKAFPLRPLLQGAPFQTHDDLLVPALTQALRQHQHLPLAAAQAQAGINVGDSEH
jgi:hypothetical protein